MPTAPPHTVIPAKAGIQTHNSASVVGAVRESPVFATYGEQTRSW